jgi:DNA-binding transcriptional MerR regulator
LPEPDAVSEIPRKSQYKQSEVCQYTDTQPYVLRFWESEFPQLRPEKTRSGQSIYSRRDLETVLRIKQLLQDEEQSISEARAALESDGEGNSAAKAAASSSAAPAPAAPKSSARVPTSEGPKRKASAKRRPKARPRLEPAEPPVGGARQESLPLDTVSRDRYENALDQIAHMKLELNDAEARRRRVEQALKKAEEANESLRERNARAIAIIEEVVGRLT